MQHLKGFGLENFRVFKEHTSFEFAPITILTGTNSSGKSSLTKGLLSVASLLEKVTENSYLYLNEFEIPYELLIGNFDSCKHKARKDEMMIIELPIQITNISLPLTLQLKYSKHPEKEGTGLLHNLIICHGETNVMHSIAVELEKDKELIWETNINFLFLHNCLSKEVAKFNQFKIYISELNHILETCYDEQENIHKIQQFDEEKINTHIDKIINLSYNYYCLIETYSPLYRGLEKIINKKEGNITYNLDTEILQKYNPEKTLLEISYLLDEDKYSLPKLYAHLFSTDDELLDFINQNQVLKKKYQEMIEKGEIEDMKAALLNWFSAINFGKPNGLPSNAETLGNHDLREFHKGINDNFPFSHSLELKEVFKDSDEEPVFYEKGDAILTNKYKIKESPLAQLIPHDSFIVSGYNGGEFKEENFSILIDDILLESLNNSLLKNKSFLQSLDYLPSIRYEANRIYLFDNNNSLFKQLLMKIAKTPLGEQSSQFMRDQVKRFGIADDVMLDKLPDGIGTRVVLLKNGYETELSDVGYGVSQILPIILKIALDIHSLRDKKTSGVSIKPYLSTSVKIPKLETKIYIIEEAEGNLHPALQSKLADMFFECYQNYGFHFILETHSEYMVRKFQYLVAKGKMKKEDIVIYYFNDPNNIPAGEPQVKKIEILEDGRLSKPFGTGFYDETAKLMSALLTGENLN